MVGWVLFMLLTAKAELLTTDPANTALPSPVAAREPYTYSITSEPDISNGGRKIECQTDPQHFLQGISFQADGDTFDFLHNSRSKCLRMETGCWSPEVNYDADAGSYADHYKNESNLVIKCTGGRSAGEDSEIWCIDGEWQGSSSGDVVTADVCACTVTGYGMTGGACVECREGSYSKVAESENQCVDCAPGHYSAVNGSTECDECLPGTYTSAQGSSLCKECSAGYYANEPASQTCEKCPRGSFNTEDGLTECSVCPVGHTTYLDNACIGPKFGMRHKTTKITEWLETAVPDVGTFRNNVRIIDNLRGMWYIYSSIHYVKKTHYFTENKKYQMTATADSIKPVLRNVYCWVSGELFTNTQFVTTASGAACIEQTHCTNEGQLSKEPQCKIDTHKWEACDVPKCKAEEEQCHHMDSGVYGRVLNVKKGHCWDGRGYPAITDGRNIGYNQCNEPVTKSTTDHSYQYLHDAVTGTGQIRSMRAKVRNHADLCLTLLSNDGVVLKTCGSGEQSWKFEKKGCMFKLIAGDGNQCVGCNQKQNGAANCDLHVIDCDSDYVWHEFLPNDDESCVYEKNTEGQKPKDSVYNSLKFDSLVAAKTTCNQLGYKCRGYVYNKNDEKPRFTLLSGEMKDDPEAEAYYSKSKECDETIRTAVFEYTDKNALKEINIDTSSSHINDQI